jgi:hypothetical protein
MFRSCILREHICCRPIPGRIRSRPSSNRPWNFIASVLSFRRSCPHPVLSPHRPQPFPGVTRSLCLGVAPIGRSNDGSWVPPPLISSMPPLSIVFPIESMKALCAPSRSHRSAKHGIGCDGHKRRLARRHKGLHRRWSCSNWWIDKCIVLVNICEHVWI